MHHCWIRYAPAGLALMAMAACSGSGNSNNNPSTPSGNTTTSLVLGGTWSGTLAATNDPDPDHFTWTATQTGTSVTGSVVFTMQGAPPKIVSGTMTGAASGTEVTLTFTLPPGTFTPFGAPQQCSMTGMVTSSPTATAITGTMTRTFTSPCTGFASKGLVDVVQLSLTKQ